MATKRIVKTAVAKTKARTTAAARTTRKNTNVAKPAVLVNANPVKKAVLAGLGAAERMQKRVKKQGTKIYGGVVDVISRESDRLTGFGSDTAKLNFIQKDLLVLLLWLERFYFPVSNYLYLLASQGLVYDLHCHWATLHKAK